MCTSGGLLAPGSRLGGGSLPSLWSAGERWGSSGLQGERVSMAELAVAVIYGAVQGSALLGSSTWQATAQEESQRSAGHTARACGWCHPGKGLNV